MDGRTGNGSEPKLCFDLLIVNMGILTCLCASIHLNGVKRAALDGVKALSRDGVREVISTMPEKRKQKKVNRSWETRRDRSTWRV